MVCRVVTLGLNSNVYKGFKTSDIVEKELQEMAITEQLYKILSIIKKNTGNHWLLNFDVLSGLYPLFLGDNSWSSV